MKTSIYLLGTSVLGMVGASPLPRAVDPTYFFTFGNSYTMTTFNTSGEQPSPSNPMGNPALGSGTTTGGINWVGFLTTQDNDSLVLSYNLAFGGAVIDNSIIKGSQKCDMVCQVDLFQSTYSSKPESAPWTSENAVFGFWIGINDAGNGYSNTDPNEIIPKLMKRYESLVEKIYSDGGRKFLFLNVPPTSRTPSFLAQGSDVQKTHMEWVAVYNKQLASMVKGFETDHPDATVVAYDSFSFMNKILDHPAEYGFPNNTCINDDGSTCIWWNNYHPSAKYHQLQASDMKGHMKPLGAW